MSIATNGDFSQALTAEVRAIAARRNLRRKDIAAAMGVSEMYLSRRMNGLVDWTAGELYDLARVLECGVADFIPADSTSPNGPSGDDSHRRELARITSRKSLRPMTLVAA